MFVLESLFIWGLGGCREYIYKPKAGSKENAVAKKRPAEGVFQFVFSHFDFS